MIVSLVSRGGRWDVDRAFVEQHEFDGHIGFVTGLRERGVVMEVGPLGDPGIRGDDELLGLLLLDVDSAETAARLFADDPIVRAGICSVRYPWIGAGSLTR